MSQKPLHTYLAMYRRRSGLSQSEVGMLLGIERGTVSHHEIGSKVPTFETLLGYVTLYGAPLTELFAGACHQVDSVIRSRASELVSGLYDSATPRAAAKIEFLSAFLASDDFTYIPCHDDSPSDGAPLPSCPPPPELPM